MSPRIAASRSLVRDRPNFRYTPRERPVIWQRLRLRIGLASRVVAHDALMPTALELAQEIAANPPLAVQRMKQGLRRALDPDWTELGAWVTASLAELFRTEDHREGVAAFLEKRDPQFRGR